MNHTILTPDHRAYPAPIEQQFGHRPAITALGNLDLINTRPMALFCSIKCPGDVILKTYDLIRALREAGIPMIGGFHSPMEKECLALLLRGTQPIIVCPARGIETMRIPADWSRPIADGRLLVLSPFDKKQRRITADNSDSRNLFVAGLADHILVAHAGSGSKTEDFCRRLTAAGRFLWTTASPENANLVGLGAVELPLDGLSRLTRSRLAR